MDTFRTDLGPAELRAGPFSFRHGRHASRADIARFDHEHRVWVRQRRTLHTGRTSGIDQCVSAAPEVVQRSEGLRLHHRLQQCYDANALFHRSPTITLRSGTAALRLTLWDEDQRELPGIRHAVSRHERPWSSRLQLALRFWHSWTKARDGRWTGSQGAKPVVLEDWPRFARVIASDRAFDRDTTDHTAERLNAGGGGA